MLSKALTHIKKRFWKTSQKEKLAKMNPDLPFPSICLLAYNNSRTSEIIQTQI